MTPPSFSAKEMIAFSEDEQLQKRLPRMFLIKNESWGFEDNQMP